jgi:methylenetetrahydrofolate reductase (NADPH)
MIYEHADKLGRLDRLLEIQAPLDWSRVGQETWGTVYTQARKRGLLSPFRLVRDPYWGGKIEALFHEIRQPNWWQGDDRYHPPEAKHPVSSLQRTLARGEFAVTAEIAPPKGAKEGDILENAAHLQGLVHAVNITQNPMATAHMSAIACSLLLVQSGIEPILQLTARDYNRYALQSEVLGAAALGIHNVLCLTGDAPTSGRSPAGELPFDLDATQMLWILRRLRDKGIFLDGRAVTGRPQLFLGTAGSPNDPKPEHEALRLEKKINAGAQYIQTQLVYDVSKLAGWLEALEKRGLLDKVHILVGIGPLRSARTARFLQEKIPDVSIPYKIIKRMGNSTAPEETGFEIALELIGEVKSLPGIGGVHIMSMGWERILPGLLSAIE